MMKKMADQLCPPEMWTESPRHGVGISNQRPRAIGRMAHGFLMQLIGDGRHMLIDISLTWDEQFGHDFD